MKRIISGLKYATLFWISAAAIIGCFSPALSEETSDNNDGYPAASTPDEQFQELVGFTDINSSISITVPEETNDPPFSFGETISILIENQTDSVFRFDFSTGPELFRYVDGWVGVEIFGDYIGDEVIVEPHGLSLTSATPVLEDISESTQVRILIVGELYEGNTFSKEVGAYVDVTVLPKP